MKNLLLEYKESIEFKKLGFDEPCFAYFDEVNDLEPYKKFTTQFDNMVNSYLPSINDSILDGVSNISECCTAPTYEQAFQYIYKNFMTYSEFYIEDNLKTFGYMATSFSGNVRKDSNLVTGFSTELDAKKHFIKNFLNNLK